jgi:uncharacterized membrane protein YfcA
MTNSYPHELALGDVYFSPILPVIFFAFLGAVLTVMVLNRLKLSRFFYAPPYVFIAIMTLYMLLIDRFWIRF